jgi:predicted transcriptional regulator
MSEIERLPVPELDAENARALTDQIKSRVETLWELIKAAYHGRAWIALGYESWDAYCDSEFQTSRLRLPREERADVVVSLRDSGVSQRAIALATGLSQPTISRELSGDSHESPEADESQAVESEAEFAEEFDKETAEEKRIAAREHLAEIELQAIASGDRIPTDEELEPKRGKLSALANSLQAEAEIVGAAERFQKLAKQLRAEAKKIVDYGTIPDNGGVSMGPSERRHEKPTGFFLGINSVGS